MNIYQAPTTVRLSVQFTVAATGTPADPSAVTLRLTRPGHYSKGGDEEAHADVTRDGVGAYHYDLDVIELGYWLYRWRGTGAVIVTSAFERFKAV